MLSDSAVSSDHSDEDLIPARYHWIRFKWMLFKDSCKHWNNIRVFLFALLMPSIICLAVVILRYQIPGKHITATNFPVTNIKLSWRQLLRTVTERQQKFEEYYGSARSLDLTYNSFTPRLMIAYAPDLEAIRNIMNEVYSNFSLKGNEYAVFSTCDELRKKMSTEHYLAGICFNEANFRTETESVHKVGIYPNRLEYSIIFPSELRRYRKLGDTWDTTNIYGKLGLYEHSNGFESYTKEGFIMIQKLISEAYIHLITNSTSLPNNVINLRRFPVAEHYYDSLSDVLEVRLSLLLVGSYTPLILYLVWFLVHERQAKLDKLLEILDVTPLEQFYSWFVFTLAAMSVGTIIFLIILKIPWNNGFGVFNRTNFSCLFALLTAFNINTLTFCFMVSKFFRNPTLAVGAAPILWAFLYIPFAVPNESNFAFISVFGNSAFAQAMHNIFELEHFNGLKWCNFFKHYDLPEYYYSVGSLGLIMLGLSIIQIFFGIFIQKIINGFKTIFKSCKKNESGSRATAESTRYSKTIIFEVRATQKPILLEVSSVTVEQGNKTKLLDVSFSLYKDEITILMGHNGSGKTTLLQVIAGFINPNSGKVVLKENTAEKDEDSSRDFMGVCFTDTLLFQQLNVKHQLTLFGRLKGLNSNDVRKEVKRYLDVLELDVVKYKRTERLTCGQRSKLAVGCALIGGSKIIILDDVTLKLDVRDYQLIWRLLEKEKFGRCILASSNSSYESELHADNVVMLAQGRLKCNGTPQFLKSMYCFGFHLIISKSEQCKPVEVTKLLSKFMPEISPTSDLVQELVYLIETSDIETTEKAFRELESAKEKLGIISIAINETPMEELFCKLGAERPAYDDHKRYLRIFNGKSITSDDIGRDSRVGSRFGSSTASYSASSDELLFMTTQRQYQISAFQNIYNQWYAMYYKFYIFNWVYKYFFPALFLTLFVCILICAYAMQPGEKFLPELEANIGDYGDSTTLLSVRTSSTSEIRNVLKIYKQIIYWKNSYIKTIDIEGQSISDYFLQQQCQNQYNNLNLKVVLGLGIQKHFTAWYNTHLPHSSPLSLNILHNALLGYYLNTTDAKILVTLELLPKQHDIVTSETDTEAMIIGSKLGILLAVILCYLVSIKVIVFVNERSTGFVNLQRRAGLNGFNLWMASFLFDMVKNCIIMVLFLLAAWLLLPPQHTSGFVLRWVVSLILLGGAALISTNYFLCLFFTSNYRAYLVITSLHAIGVASFIIFPNVLKNLSSTTRLPLRIFPLFSFCNGVYNVYKYNEQLNFCNNKIITTLCIAIEECKKIISKCENKELQVEEDVTYLYIITALSWLGITIYECRDFFKRMVPFDNYDRALDEHKRRHASESIEVDSVTAEAIKVQTMKPRMRNFYTVICEKLGLLQKRKILVDRLTFTIQPGETFGIIGTNCNCTDALLNLLAGEQRPTFGRIYVNTVSMVNERWKAIAHVGYVPTINSVMPEMTCYQILKMFCILYAYPLKQIDAICENLSQHFGFYSHFDVRLDRCSMGIRERISYSIAILMKPAFLCIGSYSWRVDPHGRRQLYRLLDALCKQGTAVTMTSVVNCFTEILCTKIAVMQEGQILHIGKPSQIASAIADGYFVTMRMRKMVQTPQGLTSKVYFRLTSFMEKSFPSSILVEEGTLMQFFIPRYSTTLSAIFKIIRLNSFQLNIESVSIASIDMNYVFGIIIERARRSAITQVMTS